ncbi:hypothetical protein R3P38DRAFT_3186091 [Favolaschia claudopus]|uniref:Uncharacterized protein n=1 Tax=Favolaschia claudopus TaxID=2862362 RepID=A0AAW0C5Q1_9AGAR
MPPRIDLNSLPAFSDIPGGPLKSLNKPELFSVARELGIGLPLDPRTITVETLRGQVTQGIGKLPNDVRFHKFIVHRAQTTGGAALRNSADKDKEDVGAKDVQPTGAHRKLLEQRVKSDPAGQLKHLKAPADADKHKGKARQSLGSPDMSRLNDNLIATTP